MFAMLIVTGSGLLLLAAITWVVWQRSLETGP